MAKKSKLQEAIHALAQISFLDLDASSTLADAVRIAEEALRSIDRDEARVILRTDEDSHKLTVQVASAAGNPELAAELAPLVTQLLDSVNEAQGGTAFEWTPAE